MYVQHNSEAVSRNHCRGKAISITYSECLFVGLSSMQSACAVLFWHLWSAWLCHIFPHYLKNGTNSGKFFLDHKVCMFWFSLQHLSETVLILGGIQQNIVIKQCFSTAGPRPGTGPWHQLYRAARGSPGIRGELSYLAPLGSENISAPYFKQCFFQGGGGHYPPDWVKHHASQSQGRNNKYFILYIEFCISNKI